MDEDKSFRSKLDLRDKYEKLKLLSSALLNCDEENLSFSTLASIKKLKLDIISESMNELTEGDALDLPSLASIASITSFLPPIETTRKLVKALITREQADTSRFGEYLYEDNQTEEDEKKVNKKNLAASYASLCISSFYNDAFKKSVHYGVILNDLDYDYMGYEVPTYDGDYFSLSQLQLQLRIQLLRDQTDWQVISNVLKDLSLTYLSCDTAMSIACVLPLLDHSEEKPFKSISSPPPLITLMALYLYSLILCIRRNAIQDVQSVPVETVISRAQHIIKEESYLIEKYGKKFSNFLHCQDLLFLDSNVDVDRFADEEEYRKDTLLGLAMTDDEPTFVKVIDIAREYKDIDLWDVYMTYLEYLLTNVNYDVEIVADRVFKQEFIDTLAVKHKQLEQYFNTRIFPLIPPDDHNRAVLCYQIIEKISCAASPKDIEDNEEQI